MQSLSQRTTEVLREIHHCQFHTTTYTETYRNHWNQHLHGDLETPAHSTGVSGNHGNSVVATPNVDGGKKRAAELCPCHRKKCESERETTAVLQTIKSSAVAMDTRDKCGLCKKYKGRVAECQSDCKSVELNLSDPKTNEDVISESVGEGDSDNRGSAVVMIRRPKRVRWEDEKGREEGEEEDVKGVGEDREEVGRSRRERERETVQQVCEVGGREMMTKRREEAIATNLPQLPHHFRR